MEASAVWFAGRIGAFYGALFLVYGATVPYLPVLLDARGLNAAEIGMVSSVPLVLRLVLTPAIAMHADRLGDHRGVIITLGAAALAAIGLVSLARGFWPLLLCVAAFQIAVQSTMPLIETIAMTGVRERGVDYGRMRLVGSATFIVATIAGASLIERHGAGIVAGMLAAATLATLVMAVLLPRSAGNPAAGARRGLDRAALTELAASRRMQMFLLAAGAVQSAHAVFYAFGVLHWRAAGIPAGWIGGLWSVGVVAEIALFWWSAAALRRLTAVDLIWLSAAAAVLRWTMMAFDPALSWLVPLQALHGLTYGACHLGAMHFIKAHVRDGQAGTAQALYATATSGIGMGTAMIVAGMSYRAYGGASYLAMAALAVIGLLAATVLRRLERPGRQIR